MDEGLTIEAIYRLLKDYERLHSMKDLCLILQSVLAKLTNTASYGPDDDTGLEQECARSC
jgi:hypothetical protein